MTIPLPLYFPKPKALQRLSLHAIEHGGKTFVMSERNIRENCQIAKERVERVMRRDYGRARRQRLEAADKIGKGERTIIRWARGETDPSFIEIMCLITATGNVDLLKAFIEPFGFTVAKTTDLEAIEKLRTADQLQPFLQASLPGLKKLVEVWEAVRCPSQEMKDQIGSTSSAPTER